MAGDSWHHVEGTYPRPGLFRVYFYDNFTQPIDVKSVDARLVGDGRADVLLKPGRGNTMETALRNERTPLKLTLKVKFGKDTPESQFDFTFNEPSKEPAFAPAPTTTAGATVGATAGQARKTAARTTTRASSSQLVAATTTRQAATTPTVAAATPPPPVVATARAVPTLTNCEANVTRADVLLLSDALPKDAPSLLDLLAMCRTEVQKLIDNGQFGFVYQPTMLGKDIVLALEGHVSTLPERRRLQVSDSIRRAVLSAWQLDLYGDLGNQAKLTEAYKLFAAAVDDITSAYGAQP
jgi:hypothetical protein